MSTSAPSKGSLAITPTSPTMEEQDAIYNFNLAEPKIEVFSIWIDSIANNERRGDLYGSIEAIDLDDTLPLYHRHRKNPEAIQTNHAIILTGPPKSLSIVTGIALNLDLRLGKYVDVDGNGNGEVVSQGDDLEDVEFCKWQFSWDVMKPEVAYITKATSLLDVLKRQPDFSIEDLWKQEAVGYDRPLSTVFKGQDGCCATMYYAILRYALQAYVIIKIFLRDESEIPPPIEYCIQGTLFGKYGYFEHDDHESSNHLNAREYCKVTFFNTGELGSVRGICGKELKLLRCTIAVPAYTSLVLEADLWFDNGGSRCQIAKGKTEIAPKQGRLTFGRINGDNDLAIQALVAWDGVSKQYRRQ